MPMMPPELHVPVAGHNAMKQVVEFYGQLLVMQDREFALERAQYQAKIAELERLLAKPAPIVPLPEPAEDRSS